MLGPREAMAASNGGRNIGSSIQASAGTSIDLAQARKSISGTRDPCDKPPVLTSILASSADAGEY
jgi:hypothetical protein